MVNAGSISTVFVSIFTYLQNLGSTINLPNFDFPPKVVEIYTSFLVFVKRIIALIPNLPDFDIRAQLMLLSLGIPILLDIVCVWFINPFRSVFFHLLDIAVTICGVSTLVRAILNSFTFGSKVLIILAVVYAFMRIIISIVRSKKKSIKMNDLANEIVLHYMTGIIPGLKTETTKKDLQNKIASFSKTVEIQKKKNPLWVSMLIFVIIIVAIIVSIWAFDVFKIAGVELPLEVKVFLPYVVIPVGAILLIYFIMSLSNCGRSGIMAVKRFGKRWGLRLLMLALDMLYIPILTNLVSFFFPKKYSCGVGSYLQYERSPSVSDNDLFYFVKHNATCSPCDSFLTNYSTKCSKACSGLSELRLNDELNLYFVDDVIKGFGGFILFNIIFVFIGIPLLWFVIFRRNRSFIKNVNIYGKTFEQKWKALVRRLQTTGIFLFSIYNYQNGTWSIVLFAVKFLVMIVSTISGRLLKNLFYLLPVIYLSFAIVIFLNKPYLYKINNILDVILYLLNLFFAIYPILKNNGITIKENALNILSIVLLILPFGATFCLLFLPHNNFMKDDPTLQEDAEAVEKERKKTHLKKNKKALKKLHDKYVEAAKMLDVNIVSRITESNGNEFLYEIIDECNGDLGDLILIKPGYLDPIEVALERKKNQKGKEEDDEEDVPINLETDEIPEGAFYVYKRMIAVRMTKMYKYLDIVLDGATIGLLTKILNFVVLFGAGAFGWYIAALIPSNPQENLYCG